MLNPVVIVCKHCFHRASVTNIIRVRHDVIVAQFRGQSNDSMLFKHVVTHLTVDWPSCILGIIAKIDT